MRERERQTDRQRGVTNRINFDLTSEAKFIFHRLTPLYPRLTFEDKSGDLIAWLKENEPDSEIRSVIRVFGPNPAISDVVRGYVTRRPRFSVLQRNKSNRTTMRPLNIFYQILLLPLPLLHFLFSLYFLNEICLKLLRFKRNFAAPISFQAVFLTLDVKVNQTNIIDITLVREFRCMRVRSTGRQLYIGCPKKSYLLTFSATSRLPRFEMFFVIEITDNVLSLSKF